jgi:hypothetical protein
MRLTKDEIRDGISFVFDECLRFAQMSIAELRQRPKVDFFCDLPHPSGRGQMNCGREAESRLRDITHEILALNKLSARVSYQTMRKLLGEVIVQRFLVEKRELDGKQVDRLVSWLGKEALRKSSIQTHLIPCHLMFVEEPDELAVGPVVFRSRKGFRKRIVASVRTYVVGPDRKWARKLLSDVLSYYRGFKWVAEVTVVPADGEKSLHLAHEAVSAALNSIHVTFGAEVTNKMAIGGPRLDRDRRGHLAIGPGEKLEVRLTLGGPGQVNFGQGWSSDFQKSQQARYLNVLGVAVESAVDPDLNRPLSRRVLDAIHWFGEGVRETTDAARVVKYVTALERLLMTREHDDIAKIVSNRTAAFCLVGDSTVTLEKWRSDARRVYDLRSRLVHGDLSPTAGQVRDGVYLSAKLARFAILSVIDHLEQGLREDRVATRRLAKWFDTIVIASEEPEARECGITEKEGAAHS